eukprot:5188530-Amphidinium_carterae.1
MDEWQPVPLCSAVGVGQTPRQTYGPPRLKRLPIAEPTCPSLQGPLMSAAPLVLQMPGGGPLVPSLQASLTGPLHWSLHDHASLQHWVVGSGQWLDG